MDDHQQPEDAGIARDPAVLAELSHALGDASAKLLIAAIDVELERAEQASFLEGFHLAALWISGPKWGPLTVAILAGALERSDNHIAKELGVSKAAVGKYIRRLRKNAGMALRLPGNSHPEETSRGIAEAEKNRTTAPAQDLDSVKPTNQP